MIGNHREPKAPKPADTIRPVRVLHVVWNLIRGGTEGQCARTAMAMGHPIAVSRREGSFLDAVEQRCGPVYEMKITRMAGISTVMEVRQLARHLRDDGIELVHAWDADAAIFGSWAARLVGVPYVTSRRDLGEIYSTHKALLMRQADRGARAVIVNAEAIKQHLFGRSRRANKVHVIPNILDIEEFDRGSAQKFSRADLLPPGRRVAIVSRFDAEKDVATFLRAAAKIETPDISFIIAGDGIQRFELEELARELKLGSRAQFLGEVTDVPALLRECHLGVLTPKTNEGLSNSILEYMAASLPVVATDCGGNRELVEPGKTGYVVPPGDVDAIADAMRHALENGGSEMGREGRRRVETRHHPRIVAAQFARLYSELIRT